MFKKSLLLVLFVFPFGLHSNISRECFNFQSLTNLSCAKQAIENYYENGEYCKDLNNIIDKAIEVFSDTNPKPNDAIIFDIDDTVLSNYPLIKKINFGYIPKLFYLEKLDADFPAIKPVKKFYDLLIDKGFKIIFITGRYYRQYNATLRNLKEQGFNKFEKLITRSKDEEKVTALEYKSKRRKELVDQGYNIIGNIGDQWSDLLGGNSGIAIKLPNYMYIIN